MSDYNRHPISIDGKLDQTGDPACQSETYISRIRPHIMVLMRKGMILAVRSLYVFYKTVIRQTPMGMGEYLKKLIYNFN